LRSWVKELHRWRWPSWNCPHACQAANMARPTTARRTSADDNRERGSLNSAEESGSVSVIVFLPQPISISGRHGWEGKAPAEPKAFGVYVPKPGFCGCSAPEVFETSEILSQTARSIDAFTSR